MFPKMNLLGLLLLAVLLLPGCQSAMQHEAQVNGAMDQNLTAGTVQKEIKIGMDQPSVAAALGSPNIVSRDSEGRECWIYDKISTETVYSTSSGGVNALVLGFGSSGAGLGGAGYSASSGAVATKQRTLTVIIKFKEGVVNDFSYHSSSF